jgi:hypothetical protein
MPSDQNAEQALNILIQHIQSIASWNAQITILDSHASNVFVAKYIRSRPDLLVKDLLRYYCTNFHPKI